MSCCARGGSWFKNCGGDSNTKLRRTWYEGIQACQARSQSKTVIGQRLSIAQQKDIDSSQGAGMANYKAVITATKTFTFTSVVTSKPMSGDTMSTVTSTYTPDDESLTRSARTFIMISSTQTSASTSIITQGCVNLLKITIHINLLFIIVFY